MGSTLFGGGGLGLKNTTNTFAYKWDFSTLGKKDSFPVNCFIACTANYGKQCLDEWRIADYYALKQGTVDE